MATASAPRRQTGGDILRGLYDWLTARLHEGAPAAHAADLLLRIEGILIAEALGRDDLAGAALDAIGAV